MSEGRVRGVVVDDYGAVIPKVLVGRQKTKDGKGEVKSVDADQLGGFELASIAAGRYQLVLIGARGSCGVAVPVEASEAGGEGLKLDLPVGATDTWESGVKASTRSGSLRNGWKRFLAIFKLTREKKQADAQAP